LGRLFPPLRERKEDVPGLIDSIVKDYCGESGMKKRSFTKDALSCLFSHSWPGNVRQLKNCILRIMVLHPGEVVSLDDLPMYLDEEDSLESESLYCNTYHEAKKSFEKRYFEKLLHRTGWDLNRAAKQSKMHLASIYRKLNTLNIKVK